MQLQFDCLENPISFDGCDELVDVLKNVLNGWGKGRIIAGDEDGAGAAKRFRAQHLCMRRGVFWINESRRMDLNFREIYEIWANPRSEE